MDPITTRLRNKTIPSYNTSWYINISLAMIKINLSNSTYTRDMIGVDYCLFIPHLILTGKVLNHFQRGFTPPQRSLA